MQASTIEILAAALFAVALVHTFSTKFFLHLAHTRPTHAGLWHLLGEVEVVFGFWAMVLVVGIFAIEGRDTAVSYLDSRNFTEAMFVFTVMVIAATRPILQVAGTLARLVAAMIPMPGAVANYFVALSLVPLLGSFITEPAAMTLAALMLRNRFLLPSMPERFKYATLGVLFVNVSIGGTLTPYAAPPVLMVAGKWGWDLHFMLSQIGWKAAVAVLVNALVVSLLYWRTVRSVPEASSAEHGGPTPWPLIVVHLLFLVGVVVFHTHAAVFLGLFLFFLGIAQAYERFQDRLILREGLLVAFFLAGLVVLGGQQQWWLQPVLLAMNETQVFWGATALTAITDNAALTYLGSLVEGLSDPFKYALVAGAVTGGGLTIIANAPNPAGVAILRDRFDQEAINPLGLLAAALPPTLVAAAAFLLL